MTLIESMQGILENGIPNDREMSLQQIKALWQVASKLGRTYQETRTPEAWEAWAKWKEN